jgi:two-component system cell cycle response regulator
MSINALIVDSSKYNRQMLESMLTGIGVTCVACSTGREALALDNRRHFDFIIASRHLEDTEAELFLLRFKEFHLIDDALTIMLTADDVADVYLDANKAGFKLVFNKKDVAAIESFLLEAINNRTIDLQAKILYVEDDLLFAELTKSLLQRYRAKVEFASDLVSAIALFREQDFDLIITDYYLGNDETGDDLISYVRDFEDSDKSRIPILVASSESSQSKRTSFLRNGANDYIIKPYDHDELVARASNLIAHKKLFEQFRQQQKELLKLAMSDQLTGLYNRRSLFDFGPKYISDALRHQYPICLLVIDVDHFKAVNDTHGHAKGDVVLKKLGEVMLASCRTADFVSRFGGEEFVILLSHCGLDDAKTKADLLRKSVEESKPGDLVITISVGVAELEVNDDLDSLFGKADLAVYKAKDNGRNRVEKYIEGELKGESS